MYDDKYIIFSPFTAGFCNVLLSYEIAFAISYITKRKLVIPPTNWCVLIDDRSAPKETWQDIWSVLDRSAANAEFDLVDLFDFEPLKPYNNKYQNSGQSLSWTSNVINYLNDSCDFINLHPLIKDIDSLICVYDSKRNTDELDLFANGRQTCDLSIDAKYLNIQGNLFGHFWYYVYAGSSSRRNRLKQKVNRALVYKQFYKDLAGQLLNVPYNALHLRNPKQLNFDDYPGTINLKDNPDLLYQRIKKLFKNDKPLYISTDITSAEFDRLFSRVRQEYQLIFFRDFGLNLKPLETIAIDQLLCANADNFYGTYYSTFTKRINVMRGVNNKQANDSGGINKDPIEENDSAMPWLGQQHWAWHMSSRPQWIYE